MALFGNKVFADVLKARIEMGSYGIRVGPKSNEDIFTRHRKGYAETEKKVT